MNDFVRIIVIPMGLVGLVLGGVMLLLYDYSSTRIQEQIDEGIERDQKINTTYYSLETCESKFMYLQQNQDRFFYTESRDSAYDSYERSCLK